jgi:hypothetical protein
MRKFVHKTKPVAFIGEELFSVRLWNTMNQYNSQVNLNIYET